MRCRSPVLWDEKSCGTPILRLGLQLALPALGRGERRGWRRGLPQPCLHGVHLLRAQRCSAVLETAFPCLLAGGLCGSPLGGSLGAVGHVCSRAPCCMWGAWIHRTAVGHLLTEQACAWGIHGAGSAGLGDWKKFPLPRSPAEPSKGMGTLALFLCPMHPL